MQIHRSSADSDSEPTSSRSLRDDTRAVTPLIGFILLFGIGVVAFASYQATTVPDQNAQTEFSHFEDVRGEMVDVRSGVIQASDGSSQFRSVKLGTEYRDRVLAVNPLNPRGTLETSDPYNATITGASGSGEASTRVTVPTRFLEYSPQYNQIEAGDITYENSILYLDERDRGGNAVPYEDARILREDAVKVPLVQNDFRKTGTQRASVDLIPGETRITDDDFDYPITISIPTKLDQSTWDDQIEDRFAVDPWVDYSVQETPQYPEGVYELRITVFDRRGGVDLGVVGVGDDPKGISEEDTVQPLIGEIDQMIDPDQITVDEGIFDQSYQFEMIKDPEPGEEVTIFIDDPIRSGGLQYPTEGEVDESELIISGEGDAEYRVDDNGVVEITYTAGEADSENDVISLSVENILADDAETVAGTYVISFVDESNKIIDRNIVISDPDSDPDIELTNLRIVGQNTLGTITEGDNEDIEVTVSNIGGDAGDLDIVLNIGNEVERSQEVNVDDEQETVVFDEVTGDLESGEYAVTVTAEQNGDVLADITDELTVQPVVPEFERLEAEVTDFQRGQGVIQEVTVGGDIQNIDESGQIEIELLDDGEDQIEERTIGMVDSFEEVFSTGSGNQGEDEVEVAVRLLDEEGEIYIEYRGVLIGDGDTINLDDGFEPT